jgi:hypothetical protein
MIAGLLAAALDAPDVRRCAAFATRFAQYVACERADGTLRSFPERQIAWRVRYFVRYWQMPCGEFPTEAEAYVFHLVTNDLYADSQLTGAQRIGIRNVMFRGSVRCR